MKNDYFAGIFIRFDSGMRCSLAETGFGACKKNIPFWKRCFISKEHPEIYGKCQIVKAQHPKEKKRGFKISRNGAPYSPKKAPETTDRPERRKTVRANNSGKLHKAHTPDAAVRSPKEVQREDKGGNTVEV